MAGDGERFKSAGYPEPKPCIKVKGRSLFSWALKSLQNFYSCNFFFVTRADHRLGNFTDTSCNELGILNRSIVTIERPTSGQAETALLSKRYIGNTSEPIFIYNIDTYVDPSVLKPEMIRGDGWIPVFEAPGSHWSFVVIDPENRVVKIAEKERISNLATVGLYYFSSFDIFERLYQACNFNGDKEKFVAPLYTQLIIDPRTPVFAEIIPSESVHVLGTPEELEEFQRSE